jgi:hypothetical protein
MVPHVGVSGPSGVPPGGDDGRPARWAPRRGALRVAGHPPSSERLSVVGVSIVTMMTVHQHGTGQQPDREPVLLADALATVLDGIVTAARTGSEIRDPRSGGETSCRFCGATAEWHRTEHGRWVLIEPGAFPTASVPAGKRWRIAEDGTAVNLGSAVPSDICRVSHLDVCVCRAAANGRRAPNQPIRRKPSVAIRPKTARSAS